MCDFCLCVSTNKLNMYVNRKKMENIIKVRVYSYIINSNKTEGDIFYVHQERKEIHLFS
nr:MAG TPA: hypothetical protein [Bacteriophage sp.]